MVTDDSPEDLPAGWTVQFNVLKTGRKIKHYIDPSTGCRFYSKSEVFQYLKTVKHSGMSKQEEMFVSVQPTREVMFEKSTDEDLPPGWIKELKITKKADRLRRDPYYIDPASGYVFRSKKEVKRYLETGEISKHAFLRKKRHISDATLPSSVAERQRVKHPSTMRQLFADKESSDTSITALSVTEASRGKRVSSETAVTVALTSEIYPQQCPIYNVIDNAESKEGYQSAVLKTTVSKINQGKRVAADNGPLLTPEFDIKQENSLESGMKRSNIGKAQSSSSKSSNKKGLNLPLRFSKRLAGLDPELVANSVSNKQVLQNAKRSCKIEANLAVSLASDGLADETSQRLKVEPTTEFLYQSSTHTNNPHGEPPNESQKSLHDQAVRKLESQELETDQSNDKRSEPELIPSFGELRSDSCLEFVLKTPMVGISVDNVADNGLDSTPAADIMRERSPIMNGEENSNNRRILINSTKSRNRKKLNMPRRSSKRLAGLEPELVANLAPSMQALQDATRSSGSEANLPGCLTSDGLADEASLQLKSDHITEIPLHVPGHVNNSEEGPSNGSQNSLRDLAVPKMQLQEPEPDKTINEKSELILPFEEFWSDPCIEFAFKTLTGAIPVETAVDKQMDSTPGADIINEKNLLMNRRENSSNRKPPIKSGKSKKREELNLPRRSSKRLAGLEPELVANSVTEVQARQNETRSSKGEAIVAVGLTSDWLVDEESQQLRAEPRAVFPQHASSDVNDQLPGEDPLLGVHALPGEPSNKSQKSLHDHVAPKEQSRERETEITGDEKPDPPLTPPFREFLSDPSLEFAFKTLTDAIPVENVSYTGLVSTPNSDIMNEKNLLMSRIEKCSSQKTPLGEELILPHQGSKQLSVSGLEFEPMTDSITNECALPIAAIKSSKIEAFLNMDLASDSLSDTTSQKHETGPGVQHANQGSTDAHAALHKEPSNKCKETFSDHTIINQSQKLEIEKMNGNMTESQPFFSIGDYWSDPCLEFAIKTLTGAIPVEENLPIQSYFQQQVNNSHSQGEFYFQQQVGSQTRTDDSLALPDFGLPSFFQTDISTHFDAPEKQPASQPPLPFNNPLFRSSGNVSLPSCSGIGSQQPHLEGSKGLSGKVNS